jgi:hypothetical protein
MIAIPRTIFVCLPLLVAVGCSSAPDTSESTSDIAQPVVGDIAQTAEEQELDYCKRYWVCWNDGFGKCHEKCWTHLPGDPPAYHSCYSSCTRQRDQECRQYAEVPDGVICGMPR